MPYSLTKLIFVTGKTLAILLLSFTWVTAHALGLRPDNREVNLSSSILYLLDPTNSLKVDQIRQQPLDVWHQPNADISGGVNLGATQATVWIKVDLASAQETADQWILEMPYASLDSVNLYLPDGNVLRNGASVPVDQRPYYSRFYAFPLTLSHENKTYYLEVRSTYPITLPITLTASHWYTQYQFHDNLMQFLYYGGLLSLLIYNLVLFHIIRDKKYLIYSLFAAFTGLGIFAGNGYAQLYLWPDAAKWSEISQSVLLCFAGSLGLIFTTRFLKTKRRCPRIHTAMFALSVIYSVLALTLIASLWLTIPVAAIYQLVFLVSLLAPVFALCASIRSAISGFNSALYFLLAWGVLCIGILIAILRLFELLPTNNLTLYAVQIASGIEMLLFSFALAYRFKYERFQRERAQSELLAAQEEMIESVRASEERLERAVETRTMQLQKLALSEQYVREQYVRFGAMIAHEFLNPLNTIASQTTILEMDPESTIEKLHKRTGVIRTAVKRLASLFNQWLESDRLNVSTGQIKCHPIEISAWLQELVNSCQLYHPEYRIEWHPCDSSLIVSADEHLLQIALLNLIDNACKYSSSGSIVEISIKQGAGSIGICIKDHGQGIPVHQLEAVLEPYKRADQEGGMVQGAGLGLAFVNHIVRLHKGRLEIDSEPEKGTRITLWLPANQGMTY